MGIGLCPTRASRAWQPRYKAAGHQHKSETTSHAHEQYHPVEMYTISKAWGLGPNLEAHPNEGVV